MQSIYFNNRFQINGRALFSESGRIIGRWNLFNRLANFFGQIQKPHLLFSTAMLKSRNQVAILYFGRTSEFLVMTSERLDLPAEGFTLVQMLALLRLRGGRWTDELDESHVLCCIDGKEARLSDRIVAGSEIEISSLKTVFEK